MTKEEARIIFKSWQDYMEIAEKLSILFGHGQIPESFLPYPVDTLEEALNIIAEDYSNSGNEGAVKIIQDTAYLHLTGFFMTTSHGKLEARKHTDEEVLEAMVNALNLWLKNPDLKKMKLQQLKECQDRWIKSRANPTEAP